MVLALLVIQLGPKAVEMLLSQCQKSLGHWTLLSGLLPGPWRSGVMESQRNSKM